MQWWLGGTMNDYRPTVPHLDDTVTSDKLHDRAEQVCIPNFDWVNQPLVAIVNGLVEVSHGHIRAARRTED
jgi:hypothetical protein